jgi:hypothetical protein
MLSLILSRIVAVWWSLPHQLGLHAVVPRCQGAMNSNGFVKLLAILPSL